MRLRHIAAVTVAVMSWPRCPGTPAAASDPAASPIAWQPCRAAPWTVPARVCSRIAEAVLLHRDATKEQAYDRAADVLDLVGLPRPRERLGECLHESTGGMRQRLMIAMALACEPKLMIAGAGLDLTPARKDRLAGSSSTLTLITVTEFHGCRGVDLQAPWAR